MTKNIYSCEERIILDAIIKYTVVTFLSVSKRRNNEMKSNFTQTISLLLVNISNKC